MLEEQEEKKKLKLDELDEDEYDNLTEEDKMELEQRILLKRKERIKKLVAGYSSCLNMNVLFENCFHTQKILSVCAINIIF